MDNPGVFSFPDQNITTPGTFTIPADGSWLAGFEGILAASLQFRFEYGSAGESVQVFLQTSLDAGDTPIDLVCVAFGTASRTEVRNFSGLTPQLEAASDGGGIEPSDGALEPGQAIDGILGDRYRLKVIVAGTYAGQTALVVRGVAR